jgi:predicted HicB family RNase H-like nuclease
MTMKNVMTIGGRHAVIAYDPEIDMFRGEFVDLSGGADFYAADVEGLRREGEASLRVFLGMCAEDGVEPFRSFSGRFNARVSPELHADIAAAAVASGKSLNQFLVETLENAVHA